MSQFNQNIARLALECTDFRREIYTDPKLQLVLMSIEPGEEIGAETHQVDQMLVFVAGAGKAVLNREESAVAANHLVVVPAGTMHNFINTGNEPLKLYTIYAPPEEEPGTVHKTKAEAEAAEHHHD